MQPHSLFLTPLPFILQAMKAGGVRGWNNVLIMGLAFYSVHKGFQLLTIPVVYSRHYGTVNRNS